METVHINPDQIQALIDALHYVADVIFFASVAVCVCLGFNAWETSAK